MTITERFPRPQQTDGLGSEIRKATLNLIQTVMIANSGPGTAANRDLDLRIDYLQVLVRLARDLRYISIGQYEVLAGKIVEIGRMNNGWMKAKRA